VASSFDELGARQRFEFRERFGDRRLAQVEPLRRAAEITLLGNGQKARDVAKAKAVFHHLRL